MKNNLKTFPSCRDCETTAWGRCDLPYGEECPKDEWKRDFEAELRFMKCQIKTKPCWNLIDEILGEK